MQNSTLEQRLLALYPTLGSLPKELLQETLSAATLRTAPAGTVFFDESNPCQAFPMLLEGTIRISKVAASGRELPLYRVVPGESCILSTSCMLGTAPYSARGVAETDVTVLALPPAAFDRLVREHAPFRNYIFGLFAERISDLMLLVEAIAFQKLDQRLAALLLGKGQIIHTTHQALADELGTAREIVSRLLKSFAEHGVVALNREEIQILNPQALRALAAAAGAPTSNQRPVL